MPRSTDDNWRLLGESDPYYGVLSAEQFRKENLNDAARETFFESGRSEIAASIEACRIIAPDWRPRSALDFGCGVGRLAFALAGICDRVVGVDVSPAMLAEARSNAELFGLSNVEWVQSDDDLTQVVGSFDFVHTYIVLQHIPTRRGIRLFSRLVDLVAPGGMGSLHVTTVEQSSTLRASMWLRSNSPMVNGVANRLKGRPFDEPLMEMNPYSLNALTALLAERGIDRVLIDSTNHSGDRGAILRFQKPRT